MFRKGKLASELTISKLDTSHLQSSKTPKLSATFLKSGTQSVYGDAHVFHYQPGGGKKLISTVKGMSFYTEKVTVNLPLNIDYKPLAELKGSIELEFRPEKVSDASGYIRNNVGL